MNIQDDKFPCGYGRTRSYAGCRAALKYAGEWSVFYAARLDCQNKLFRAGWREIAAGILNAAILIL
jgi:hypothetical protein